MQNATASPAKVSGPPQYGGRIILGQLGEPSNLIPPLSSDAPSHEVADLLYVAPLKYDKNIKLVPWAAKDFEILEDGKLLRFRLREDVRWFDGQELTAEDVEFTYKMMIDPKTPTAYGEDYKAVKEFRVLDKYGFEVRYDEPFARSLVTWAHSILPKHALENENLLDTKYSREPLGAGAFRLKEWVAGRRLVLEVNEDYFEGRPYLDQVVYRIIPDISTMFLELKAGNLDFMGLTPQQYLHQTNGPDWQRDFNKFKYLSFGYTYLGYNLSHAFFKDRTVRQALAHAIDKQEIVKGVLLGQGVPVIGPYKPGTWVYNENIKAHVFDPNKASQMLNQAGWRDSDGDGLLDKDGQAFSFTILTNQGNDQRIKTATIIQNRLKKIGIKVKVRTVEWAAFLKEFVDKGRFDAIILGWNITQDPDNYDVWHSSKAVPGGLNFIGYKNPELDELLERGRRILDQDRRKPIYDRVQEILHQDQPYCFLYAPQSLPIVSSRFQGLEPAPAGITHNFIRWWVPKNRQRYTPTP
ncbi:MAG: peptide-binding protein [Thermodesulfobacteriota bacterium]|nr:peptide-binding protein [Thermodesulfobacteriota bacterium]